MRASNGASRARHACCYVSVLTLLLLGDVPALRSVAESRIPPRVVAVGDVHGDFDAFRGLLERAGILDAAGRWMAGNTTLVQLGDVTDRGPKVRAALDLLIDLEGQARSAGGRVEVLLGNHEAMNLVGEDQDVTPAIYATFAGEQSEQRRQAAYEAHVRFCASRSAAQFPGPASGICRPSSKEDWVGAHPLGFVEYREAFGPQGRYGRWLRTKPAVLRLGDTVFLHAGIPPDRAPRRLEDINTQVLAEIKRIDDYRSRMIARNLILPFFTLSQVVAAAQAELEAVKNALRSRTADGSIGAGGLGSLDNPDPLGLEALLRINTWAIFDANGPLWFRGFATWSEAEGASHITKLLRRYNAAHFVVAHSVTSSRRITPRFSEAVFLIDTGMLSSFFPGGVASALEIRDGRFTAIYTDQRTTLFETGERTEPSRR